MLIHSNKTFIKVRQVTLRLVKDAVHSLKALRVPRLPRTPRTKFLNDIP
jgi:hypothetical protein